MNYTTSETPLSNLNPINSLDKSEFHTMSTTKEDSTLVLHHLNHSRSQRILWLFEELGLKYKLVKYERGPNAFAPPELKEIHPLGKSPIVTDNGVVYVESGAIIGHIIDTYGVVLSLVKYKFK